MVTSVASLLSVWLAEAAEANPAEGSFGVDLAIWKWVIIIGAGAVAVTWLVRRISEVVVARKTRSIIEQVVGRDAALEKERGWDDLDDLDEPGGPSEPKS